MRKLSKYYLRLFKVVERVGTYLYLVRLLEHLWAIHPVFHISQLKPLGHYTIPNCMNPSLPPVKIDGELEFKVVEILDSKWDR